MNAAATIAAELLAITAEPMAICPTAVTQVESLIAAPERFVGAKPRPPIVQAGMVTRSQGSSPQSPRILSGGLAVVQMRGLIVRDFGFLCELGLASSTAQLASDIRSLQASENVSSILMICDSGGGQAVGTEECSNVIASFRNRKPMHAFAYGLCASAMYYVASAMHRITATPTATVGSIGTRAIMLNYSEALKRYGIKPEIFKFGAHKTNGNPYEPMTAEARKAIQDDWIDPHGWQFVNAVARHRGLTPAAVRERYGDGRFFASSLALDRGMIDGIETLDEIIPRLSGRSSGGVSAAAPGLRFKIQSGTRDRLYVAGMIRGSDRNCPERAAIAVVDWYQQRRKPLPTSINQLEHDAQAAALVR